MMRKASLFVLLLISPLAYVGKAQSDSDDLDLDDVVEDLIDTLLGDDDSDSSDDSDAVVTADDGLLQQLITALQALLDGLGVGGAAGFATAQNNVGGTFGIIGTRPGFNTASTFSQRFSGNNQCIPVSTLMNQAGLIGNALLRAANGAFSGIPGAPGGASNLAQRVAGLLTQGQGGTLNGQNIALQMARLLSGANGNRFAQAMRQPNRVLRAIIRSNPASNGLRASKNGVNVGGPAFRLRNVLTASNCVRRNGGWSNWSAWRSATPGQESRFRTCTVPSPACGGSPCQGQATEFRTALQTARVATGSTNNDIAAAAWWGRR